MIWVKAMHVIFMVTWFAGLFYQARLYIYHLQTTDEAGHQRFIVMQRRLFIIMTIGAALTLGSGFWLLALQPLYLEMLWVQVKLALVAGLVLYHGYLWKIHSDLARKKCRHSDRWLRVFNEVPTIALILIIILAVVRPF